MCMIRVPYFFFFFKYVRMMHVRAENGPKFFGPALRPVSLIVPTLDPNSIYEDSV
jgi:hypothetical protein